MSEDSRPLYEIIYQYYKKKITNKEITAGTKLPSESEISEEFRVSRITAVRALKELELANIIYRVKGSGSFVKETQPEVDNTPEKHLSIISLVIPFEDTYFTDILAGIEDIAGKHDYFVTIHNSYGDPLKEKLIIEEIIARGSHGIILYPSSTSKNIDLYSGLLIDRYPFVVIDRELQGIETSLVLVDNKRAFYDMTKHLIAMGHQRIIFVGTSVFTISSEHDRYRGFCKAHLENQIPLMEKHVYQHEDSENIPKNYRTDLNSDERECHFLFDTLANLPIQERPTAIAAVNDSVAAVLMSVAKERGISIPEEYSLSGFDNLPFAEHMGTPLSTVEQPSYNIGNTAGQTLFETITHPDRTPSQQTLLGRLIQRESTKPPRKG